MQNCWVYDVICFPSVARFEKGDKSLKSFFCPKLNKKHELKDSQLRNDITTLPIVIYPMMSLLDDKF